MKSFEIIRRGRLTRLPWLRAVLVCTAFLALPGHVTITPEDVVAGSSQRFTVRVPTERPAATIELRLEFPEGLGAPRFLAKAGWTYELEKDASGKVIAVTWSGGEIGPDGFDEFVFTARAPAPAGTIFFKAYQTYRGGEVVAWANTEGDEEPAPRVVVQDSAGVASAAPASASVTPVEPQPTELGRRGAWMSGAALALSILALSLGLRRRA